MGRGFESLCRYQTYRLAELLTCPIHDRNEIKRVESHQGYSGVTPFLWTDSAIQPATFTRPLVALPLLRN